MGAAEKAYDFRVSEYFFKLTSESIRLFSNSIFRHCTMNEVLEARIERVPELAKSYNEDDLHTHLRLIPTDGDIELSITVLETSAAAIDAAIPALEIALGQSVRFVEAVSLMLFDIIVERNTTEVMTKLGLSSKEVKEYRVSLRRNVSNVIPFR